MAVVQLSLLWDLLVVLIQLLTWSYKCFANFILVLRFALAPDLNSPDTYVGYSALVTCQLEFS